MIASIAAEGQRTKAAPFGHALVELAKDRPEIVGMTADLAKYTDLHIFAKAYPDRFYQMGMAEQLLMGAAAGMAHEGMIPFVTTYAVFASRRAYDFIHQTIAEEHRNVKIACALPGLTSGYGPSHQAAEDLALIRAIPNMTVIDPCDALDIEQAVPAMAAHQGPVYMRLLEVANQFAADNIGVAVLHTPTIKPLDNVTILREASRSGRLVVVAENHTEIGGLGEAVAAALLCAGVTPPFRQIALPDQFLDAGALPTLHDRYGISADAMAATIKGWLG
ncbi:transketolase family protein [Azospirillum sp. sgz302134]